MFKNFLNSWLNIFSLVKNLHNFLKFYPIVKKNTKNNLFNNTNVINLNKKISYIIILIVII